MVKLDLRHGAEHAGLAEVAPIIDRVPYGGWTVLYLDAARRILGDAWVEAGFAVCPIADLDMAIGRVRAAVAEANTKFRDSLDGTNAPDHRSSVVLEGYWDIDDRGYIFRPASHARAYRRSSG